VTTRRHSRRSWKKAPKLASSTQGSESFLESIYAALEESEEDNNSNKEEEGSGGDKEDHANVIGGGRSGKDLQ
jgi:hypothetical protein